MGVWIGPYESEKESEDVRKSLENAGVKKYNIGCSLGPYPKEAIDKFPYSWADWFIKVRDRSLRCRELIDFVDQELSKVFSKYDNEYALIQDMPFPSRPR